MRTIETHKVNSCNEVINIEVLDEPGSGGACHKYRISGVKGPEDNHPIKTTDIEFQNGPIQEVGTNGITQEVLLAIVIDRLQCFQKGPYSCRENAIALTKIEEAVHWLHHRTKARVARGVEGTHIV